MSITCGHAKHMGLPIGILLGNPKMWDINAAVIYRSNIFPDILKKIRSNSNAINVTNDTMYYHH